MSFDQLDAPMLLPRGAENDSDECNNNHHHHHHNLPVVLGRNLGVDASYGAVRLIADFACSSIKEALAFSLVCTRWRDAAGNFSGELWMRLSTKRWPFLADHPGSGFVSLDEVRVRLNLEQQLLKWQREEQARDKDEKARALAYPGRVVPASSRARLVTGFLAGVHFVLGIVAVAMVSYRSSDPWVWMMVNETNTNNNYTNVLNGIVLDKDSVHFIPPSLADNSLKGCDLKGATHIYSSVIVLGGVTIPFSLLVLIVVSTCVWPILTAPWLRRHENAHERMNWFAILIVLVMEALMLLFAAMAVSASCGYENQAICSASSSSTLSSSLKARGYTYNGGGNVVCGLSAGNLALSALSLVAEMVTFILCYCPQLLLSL